MPSRIAHRYYSRQMFGKDFDELHAALDAPSRWLGPNHRRLYHTYWDANVLARLVSKDPDAPLAAMCHVLLDEICSNDPAFRSAIELQALYDSRRRRRRTANRTH